MQDSEKLKNVFFGSDFEQLFGKKDEPTNSKGESSVSAEDEAEIAIEELRNKYSEKLRSDYDMAAKKLKEERDDALRESWILQQKAEAALPEQMAASGINGGASESSLANLRAQYQSGRNDIRSGYSDDLSELSQQHLKNQSEAQRGYNEKWLEYLLSLAKTEKEYEYEKNL